MVVKKKSGKKTKGKKAEGKVSDDELEKELGKLEGEQEEESVEGKISVKASKPISKIKKGDKIKIDGKEYEVDAHYVLIDHGTTKEMTIEIFDPKTDKDYQLRYFDDRVEDSAEFFELDEIVYQKKGVSEIEW